nr:hypothetical protein [Phenylobacterium sp. Root1277]
MTKTPASTAPSISSKPARSLSSSREERQRPARPAVSGPWPSRPMLTPSSGALKATGAALRGDSTTAPVNQGW